MSQRPNHSFHSTFTYLFIVERKEQEKKLEDINVRIMNCIFPMPLMINNTREYHVYISIEEIGQEQNNTRRVKLSLFYGFPEYIPFIQRVLFSSFFLSS